MDEDEDTIINIPMLMMRAAILPKTIDVEARTVDVIFTTGARVKRGFFNEFFEELGLEKKHVRLKRLNNGAPFLNNHLSRDLDDQLGVVVDKSASVDGKKGIAKIRFAKDEVPERMFQRVIDGVLRNISVGYRIHKMEKVGEVDEIPVLRAIDWEPIELSGVPAGADDGAMFRSASEGQETNPCLILGLEKRNETVKTSETDSTKVEQENKMVATTVELRQDQNISEVNEMTPEEIAEQKRKEANEKKEQKLAQEKREAEAVKDATAKEKIRAKDIHTIVRSVGLEDKLATEYIDGDKTVDEVRTLVITAIAEKQKERKVESQHVEVCNDERDVRKSGMQEALMHRANGSSKLTDNGKQYRYFSLLRLAETCLQLIGVRTAGLSPMEIASKALQMRGLHAISDFPEILANTANKSLRDSFAAAPQTFMPFTRMVSARDFKEMSRTQLGDAPNLELLPENGEIERGTIGENAEKYAVKDYAKIIAIGRHVIINDDMGAFTRVPELMGRAAKDLESDLVWGVVNTNAALSDGNNLFSAAHGNVGTSGVISDTTLGELRALLRKQTGLNGRLMNTQMTWLWVPTALETIGEKQLAAVQPQEVSKVNPFGPNGRTPLQMIVEPRLDAALGGSDTRWYGAADIGQIDMIELARLEGEDGPVIESREGFDVLGMEISVRHTVAAKAIEHRGMNKNDG